MGYFPVSSFGRGLDAARLATMRQVIDGAKPDDSINKWDLLKDLGLARQRLGLSDRDIAVLDALLSFIPGPEIGGIGKRILFPSNASICERLNGMPCSTMRRHLSALITAGLLLRKDSPNGKRYTHRHSGELIAYGFDIGPLLSHRARIHDLANQVRAEALAIERTRVEISLLRRDLYALIALDTLPSTVAKTDLLDGLADMQKTLRRKLDLAALEAIALTLKDQVALVAAAVPEMAETEETNITAAHYERHCLTHTSDNQELSASGQPSQKRLPELTTVVERFEHICSFAEATPNSWEQLIALTDRLHPMLGISSELWAQAASVMGKKLRAMSLCRLVDLLPKLQMPVPYFQKLLSAAQRNRLQPWLLMKSLPPEPL